MRNGALEAAKGWQWWQQLREWQYMTVDVTGNNRCCETAFQMINRFLIWVSIINKQELG